MTGVFHYGQPGHQEVHRYQMADGRTIAKILPGEIYVTTPPELITTLLGSCVAACVWDPVAGMGGMNHFMLPASGGEGLLSPGGRYGTFAMEWLLNEILKAGGRRDRLEVKVFGGANMGTGRGGIGQQNVEFVEGYLAREGLHLAGRCVGGEAPRRLIFDPGSGRVRQYKLPALERGAVMKQEAAHRRELGRLDPAGGIELF